MKIFYIIVYLLNLLLINSMTYDVSKIKLSFKTNQLILVVAQSVKSSKGKLYYYIKKNDEWQEFLVSEAYLGRDGLGLQSEFDVKSPIGAFKFNKYFGIEDNPGTKLPYIKLNESLYWNSDSESSRYNQMVNIETYTDFDTSISEHLIEETIAYRYAMNINYNEQAVPYKGSAIFLHCSNDIPYTAGCVAISEKNMIKVLQNVNKNAIIIIDVEKNMYNY